MLHNNNSTLRQMRIWKQWMMSHSIFRQIVN